MPGRTLGLFASALLLVISANLASAGDPIEANPNKGYALSKGRGPWMIMVATFQSTDSFSDDPNPDAKSPEMIARGLLMELRELGMPAYLYEYYPGEERLTVEDALGRTEHRKNLRRVKSICVIAGNYKQIESQVAQDSLDWVKNLEPKTFEQEGVFYGRSPGQPKPLSGAFLTMNPLLSPADIARVERDPLIIRLNSGERYSLFENSGEYTLVIARFRGKEMFVKDDRQTASRLKDFFNINTMDDAGQSAQELALALRGNFDRDDTRSYHFNNVDAYVWHDHDESVVTVGSFKSPKDPAIKPYLQLFGPKVHKFATGDTNYQSEHLGIKDFPKKGEQRLWLFEPNPQIIRVPRVE